MKLTINIWNTYLLGFTFLISYLNVISSRIIPSKGFNWLVFTPEAPIASLVNAIIVFTILKFLLVRNNNILLPKIKWKKLSLIVFTGLLFYIIISNLMSVIAAIIFDSFDRNFQPIGMVTLHNMRYIVDYFLYSIIFMAYVFYNKNIQQEQHLKTIEKSLNRSNLANLRAQLNPHFLFNNLNSLDELIYTDKDKASDFLADFASLYRFCLENANQHLISLEDELNFAQSYFDMMLQKYPDEYLLQIHEYEKGAFLIPPFTCQTLIENVIEHNRPDEKGVPIHIVISLKDDYLIIQNDKTLDTRKTMKSGKAIKNLRKQYELLETRPLIIENNRTQFTIKIPLISND
ncbi:sensor histidine kinase [Tenacibaculum amylolyticum]|uniref:sensor histidine kinase n=1 Tax=Tenacibaculum amylolyticum TaxID=104269 RepID=UPI0038940D92